MIIIVWRGSVKGNLRQWMKENDAGRPHITREDRICCECRRERAQRIGKEVVWNR